MPRTLIEQVLSWRPNGGWGMQVSTNDTVHNKDICSTCKLSLSNITSWTNFAWVTDKEVIVEGAARLVQLGFDTVLLHQKPPLLLHGFYFFLIQDWMSDILIILMEAG